MNLGILHNRRPAPKTKTAGPLPMHKVASQMGVDPASLGAEAQHIWSMLDDMAATDPAAYQEFIASQMEAQAKAGRKKFTPVPGFVIKYAAASDGASTKKLFINCCAHECVALPTNPNNNKAVPRDTRSVPSTSNLSIPLAIGDLRTRTLSGEVCSVVDAVFHPWVLERAAWDAKFKMDVMQLASHWVEEEKHVKLQKPGKLIKSLYKGGIGIGTKVVPNDFYVPEEGSSETPATSKHSNQADNNPTTPVTQWMASPKDLLRSLELPPSARQEKLIEDITTPAQLKTKKTAPVVKKGFLNATKAPLYPSGSTEGKPASAYVNLLHRSKVVDLTSSPMEPKTDRAAPAKPPMMKAAETTVDDVEFERLCLDAEPELAPRQQCAAGGDPLFSDDMARLFLQTLQK
ncbi:hypothetical protein SPRG_06254 [Saprolegnia parasitica CBS 223.65]|uniref:PIH1 N-terminal domain-containing protein n=1 Tax=Saprolegnia parasitica (strain CBS 223.65) TaxID=695850 RepID=A0A067CGD7_SAPPC|nr:hypothetical protein SPRG_06254 [Saprolegnia parasitica CBS 223.65]KDO28205.1 hypothetical protein SPRG_06254 [Saprolegnia parasitica CBS 223.65]|eukprot:XP_012201030.1 hypothetical protein SPRG_06254 [Saprolegnia parasitica CBS 223.65]